MINSSSRRLSSNNAPPGRRPARTRLIPLTLAVLSIVWAVALIVSTSPAAEVVNAQPNQQNQSPAATSTPPTPTPTATSTPPTPTPTATSTPPAPTPTPTVSCSIDEIELSQSYTSGLWDSSDCYSIRQPGIRVDYYTFTLAEITQVRIDLESSVVTPYLHLIRGADPRGSTSWLERNFHGGEGRNARIRRTLNPGSYTIAASPLGSSESSYKVRVYSPEPVEGCSIDEIELSQSYISDSWHYSDCYSIRRVGRRVDYYTFTLAETTQIRIDLESSVDPYLYLIRGADPRTHSNPLEHDDDDGDGRNARIQRTLNPGSYTIAATTYGRNREGSYKVRVYDVESSPTPEATSTPTPPSEPTPEATSTPTPPPTATTTPETPPAHTESCSTNEIDLSQSYRSGSWTHSDCYSIRREGTHVDYYTFTLAETTPVRIDLESSVDTYLYLIRGADPRSSSSSLESDDDSGHGRNSRIQRTLDPGSYTIAATTLGRNREGSYSVRVYNVDSTSTATTTPATSASCSTDEIDISRSYTSGSWTPSDCDSMHRDGSHVDYYTFTLTETTQIRIDLESSVDPHLYLIRGADPRGSTGILASDDDSGHGFNARLRLTLNPGSYTIAATTYNANGEGSYSVRVYDVDSDAPA